MFLEEKDKEFDFYLSTQHSRFNFTQQAHLYEQIDNINFTIASWPDARSFNDGSSDFLDEFVDGDFADLAENIYVHYKTCNSQNAS